MLTRCPSCTTTFRVTPEQLKARQGKVRCGECQGVFNALDTLIEEAIAIPADTTPPPPEQEPVPEIDLAVPPAPTPDPTPEPEAALAVELEPELHIDEVPPRRRWPWVVGGLMALCALLLQGLVLFRIELSILHPDSRSALQVLCDVAGCELGLPRKVELVGIETSDLHPDTASPERLNLVATVRNRAPFAQELPHLELTLTDAMDKALVRRVLAPRDYLPKKADPAAGIAAGSDLAVSLILEAGKLPAAGYRLYLFYP